MDNKVFDIIIKGHGIVHTYATSQWHALDKCYSQFRTIEPNRTKYSVKPKGITTDQLQQLIQRDVVRSIRLN